MAVMVAARRSLTGSARKTPKHLSATKWGRITQAGQQEAHLRLTQRHKALLAGDLNAHRKDAGHIDAHGPCGVLNEGGIGSEDAGHQARARPS